MPKKPLVKIVSQEEAFWTHKKAASQQVINEMKIDLKRFPKLKEFHQEIINLCDRKIEYHKHSGRNT